MRLTSRRKLFKIGGSRAVIIPPEMLKLVGIVDEVDVRSNGRVIVITAVMPKIGANDDVEQIS